MTQELLERTVRDWVFSNPARGARNLDRLAGDPQQSKESPQAVADALIELAGRIYLDHNRIW